MGRRPQVGQARTMAPPATSTQGCLWRGLHAAQVGQLIWRAHDLAMHARWCCVQFSPGARARVDLQENSSAGSIPDLLPSPILSIHKPATQNSTRQQPALDAHTSKASPSIEWKTRYSYANTIPQQTSLVSARWTISGWIWTACWASDKMAALFAATISRSCN